MKNLAILVLAASLAACGGGGGGGDSPADNKPSPAPSSTGLTINFSDTTLAFDQFEGAEPSAQTVWARATGSSDKNLLMGAEVSGAGIATPIDVTIDSVARTGAIKVMPARGLAAGTYRGAIKLLACTSQDCAVQHAGSPHTVNYTVTVRERMKPSQTALNLSAVETGSSAVNEITFNPPPASNVYINASASYRMDDSNNTWLSVKVTGNTLRVQASAASMKPGAYTANVVISTSDNRQSVVIPVTLTVGAGLSVPDGAGLKIDSGTTAQQMQGTIAIAVGAGAGASQWTAVSDQPWLKLNQATGGFGTLPAWRIDPAAFSQLANNQHHKAVVRIATDSTLPARTFTLDVHKALAEIKGLDSLTLLAGQSGDVLVYGSGFDTMADGALSLAGARISSVVRVSDKVLRVSLPAMAAGSYPMSLASASGLGTQARPLQVTGRTTYAYQSLDTQGLKGAVVWDAVTQSAFVVNKTLKSVMRYAPVGGKFQLVATRSFPMVDSIAMSPDRTALVLQSASSKIYKLAPNDLSTVAMFDLRVASDGSLTDLSVALPVMGDNRLLHPSFGWVDLDTGSIAPLTDQNQGRPYGYAQWAAVSGNGLRMLWPASGLVTPSSPMLHTDLVSSKFAIYDGARSSFFYRYSVNHDGSKWAYDDSVVDFDNHVLGRFKLPEKWLGNQTVFSRSGARLYYYAQSDIKGVKPRIYVFDTSEAMTTTVNFPVLGYIEFDDLPNCPYDSYRGYYEGCYTFESHIAISDDDQTLFIAGDTRFTVVPVPLAMRSAAPLRQNGALVRAQGLIAPKRN